MRGFGEAEIVGAIAHLGQQGRGDIEQAQQLLVPALTMDVEQQRPAGVGRVGRVAPPAGEPPEQPGIDGAEGELAGRRAFSGAGQIVEQPGELGGGEIGVEPEAGTALEERFVAVLRQAAAMLGGAAVLPDDGVGEGASRRPVPE